MINLYTIFGTFANNLLDFINIQYIFIEILFYTGIIIFLNFILLSTGKKAVDVAHKIITGVAAGTVVSKILFGSDGSDKKDEDKNKKDKDKQEKPVRDKDKNETSPPHHYGVVERGGTINNIKHSFSPSGLTLILSYLDINIDKSNSSINNIFIGIFILTLISILCFINVLGYLSVCILIQNCTGQNYEEKYPKFIKIINYFKKGTILYVIIEALICLLSLIFILFISFIIISSPPSHYLFISSGGLGRN